MKYVFVFLLLISYSCFAQIGINTTDPKGELDVVTTNDLGIVIPRVSRVENVTDGNGCSAPNGTVVYDLSRKATCYLTDDQWICTGLDGNNMPQITNVSIPEFTTTSNIDYFKPSRNGGGDRYGWSTTISADGCTLAIGANNDSDASRGIDNTAAGISRASGAVYIYTHVNDQWLQQAYIKSAFIDDYDFFGQSISLSENGNVLVVGAPGEQSNATLVNGDQTDNNGDLPGAAFVFQRTGSSWAQTAYLKAPLPESRSNYGSLVDISQDGKIIAVSATLSAALVGATDLTGSINSSGAVFLYSYNAGTWSFSQHLKASNPDINDRFGSAMCLNYTGDIIAITAPQEDSNGNYTSPNPSNNSNLSSGAVYVFEKNGTQWVETDFLKAPVSDSEDFFGFAIDINNDGTTLIISSLGDRSNATGINGDQLNNNLRRAGAIHVYENEAGLWIPNAYLKTNFTRADMDFGFSIAIDATGLYILASARYESSTATGINGDDSNNGGIAIGACYLYKKSGNTWLQDTYFKPLNSSNFLNLGYHVSMSRNGKKVVLGAPFDSSDATIINGDFLNTNSTQSGAVYVYSSN